jgi:glycosyltransferase involved in cell wall biosynthesis
MNMEATIETALTSVLDQLDDTYEMVVVDESTDGSRQVLLKMQSKYQNLKTVFLEPNRK